MLYSFLALYRNGYVVENWDGNVVAAFVDPADALSWAASCHTTMLHQDWSEDLLSHYLCEEIFMFDATNGT